MLLIQNMNTKKMMIKSIVAAVGLFFAANNTFAAPINSGLPPGASAFGNPFPKKTGDGRKTILYALAQTRNGVRTIVCGWTNDHTNCGLLMREATNRNVLYGSAMPGRYKAELVWTVVTVAADIPKNVGPDPKVYGGWRR